MKSQLATDGFEIARLVLDEATVLALRNEFECLAPLYASKRNGVAFGMRGIMDKSTLVREIANSPELKSLVEPVLDGVAFPIRSILFDKTKQANWPLPWHQDRVIALAERHEIEGYVNWTIKDGVDHAEPPIALLKNIATVRLHLDGCDETNGALRVARGWQDELLSSAQLAEFRHANEVETLGVDAGDAVLMRPLTPHSSQKSTSDQRRRVLHLEYCCRSLPEPLQWKETA